MKNIKKFDNYNEYLEIAENMNKHPDAKNIFAQAREDTGEVIKKYLEDVKKDPIILNIENNFKNKLKLNPEQQKNIDNLIEKIFLDIEKTGIIKFIKKQYKDDEIIPYFSDRDIQLAKSMLEYYSDKKALWSYLDVKIMFENFIWYKKDYNRILYNFDSQEKADEFLVVIFNEKDRKIYKNYLEIKDLFEYGFYDNEDYQLYQSGEKIQTILYSLVHTIKAFDGVYLWANNIKDELFRITNIDILEFGLLSEFLSVEFKLNDYFWAEDWWVVDEIKEDTGNFDRVLSVAMLNRNIALLKQELEMEKKKKKGWFFG